MKKVLVVLALSVPFAAMLAAGMPVISPAEGAESTGTPLLPAPAEEELKEDEGSPVMDGSGLILALWNVGEAFAVKLTPPSYPFEITAVKYAPISWLDTDFETPGDAVFFSTGLGGKPGDELGRKAITPSVFNDFERFDVSDVDVSITSGSFFFALQATEPAQHPERPLYPAVWPDHAYPEHHVSWGYLTFTHPDSAEPFQAWLAFDEFGITDPDWPPDMSVGDSIDMIMRVIGDIPGIGEVVLGPGGVIEIAPLISVFSSEGSVSYTLPKAGDVEVTLWDALGRRVQTLYTGHADAGEHTLAWDASALPRGAYFIRLKTLNTVSTAKVVLID